MNGISLNLTTIAIAWVTASVILIPLLIAAVRLAAVPLLDALSRNRAAPADRALEERLIRIEAAIDRLTEPAAAPHRP